jgi:hypothetical protein
MNWKIFSAACVSIVLATFPQNIIGCGPDADPYDYYTSFFHQQLPGARNYQPFYYTSYNFLYDEAEPVATADVLSKEWATYCGNTVTAKDAKAFVTEFAWKDLNNLYYHVEKKQPLKIPDSVLKNNMTTYFMQQKKLEALGYIMYAKKAAPMVGGSADYWQAPVREQDKMDKHIKNGFQLLNVAKDDFIKLRYVYQILRLAHYSQRHKDVIDWYEKYMTFEQSTSVIKNLCTALKAGALFRNKQTDEAAYLFSKTFAANDVKRVSNFLGFNWSVQKGKSREHYLSLCKNNKEKANMLAMFALNSINSELPAMQSIYQLDPGCDALEVLAVREINKAEQNYFTPLLQKEKGGKALYFYWGDGVTDSAMNANKKSTVALADFFHKLATNNNTGNSALFETGAAYLTYILKDYSTAKKYLAAAAGMQPAQKLKDQQQLTQLLISINETNTVDAAFEETILPSLQWLREKAKTEKPVKAGFNEIVQWQIFYRNLMSEVLATRYHQQNEKHKEALCIGAADNIKNNSNNYYSTSNGIYFLRNNLSGKDINQLFALFEDKQPTKFTAFLLANNSIKKTTISDFAGTAYLREYDFTSAIAWFKKATDKKANTINTNPFADLLYDREEALLSEAKFITTKLAFAQEMLRLQQLSATDKANAAKHLYKMATGFYNMTYYGHAWKLVQYYRSGSDGYYIPDEATGFQKEYYGCYKAHEHFEKAMQASTDKNFKARCLFMMAKCAQKNIRKPQYSDFPNYDYEKYDAAEKKYFLLFKNNKYFPQLKKEYGNTPFYETAFDNCSYLRDFVAQK